MGNWITLLIFHPLPVMFICGENARQEEAEKRADVECEEVQKKIRHLGTSCRVVCYEDRGPQAERAPFPKPAVPSLPTFARCSPLLGMAAASH
jgi:hypothetical protein